jgi:copper chaperone CopZ
MKLTPVLALSALLTLPGAVVARTAPAQKSGTAQVRIVQCALKVNGMHCQGCAEGVRAALLKLPGVKAAEVDYERGTARVEFDPARTSPEKIVAAFNDSVKGFRVELQQHHRN